MKRVTEHLQYAWWQYVLVLAISAVLWIAVFTSLAQPKDNEKLDVCFFGDQCDSVSLNEQLSKDIRAITQQTLKEVTVSEGASSESTIYEAVMAGMYISDVMVFEKGILPDEYLKGHFPQIPEGEFEGLPLYRIDGVAYGIVLNPGYTTRFSERYEGEKLCIAFFCPESVNTGGLFGKGQEADNAALSVVRYLAEEVEQ